MPSFRRKKNACFAEVLPATFIRVFYLNMEEAWSTVSTTLVLGSGHWLIPCLANIHMVARGFTNEADFRKLAHANKVARLATIEADGTNEFRTHITSSSIHLINLFSNLSTTRTIILHSSSSRLLL